MRPTRDASIRFGLGLGVGVRLGLGLEPSRGLALSRSLRLRLRLTLTVYQEAIGARALLPARPEGASRVQEWADLGFEGFLHALARHPLVLRVLGRVRFGFGFG